MRVGITNPQDPHPHQSPTASNGERLGHIPRCPEPGLYSLSDPPPAKEIDRLVRARPQRPRRLFEADTFQLTSVVSQGALERCARDEAVATAQLAQLRERAMWSNVELRVLPFDLGPHVGTGPFTLLAFPDHLLPDAAYQEYAVGGHIIDDHFTTRVRVGDFG